MNKFFCGGHVKTGTTFLQRLLDLHPEVICESEHNLSLLLNRFIQVKDNYNNELKLISEAIGTESKPLPEKIYLENFYTLVEKILEVDKQEFKSSGISDNNFIILNAIPLLERFTNVKIIYIVRNPMDVIASMWDHWTRLYKDYNHNPNAIRVLEVDGKLDKNLFAVKYAKAWNESVKKIIENYNFSKKKVKIIKYENLKNETFLTLSEIFEFLNVSTNKKILDQIVSKSSLSFMRKNSTNAGFYMKARSDFGKSEFDEKTIKKIKSITKETYSFYY